MSGCMCFLCLRSFILPSISLHPWHFPFSLRLLQVPHAFRIRPPGCATTITDMDGTPLQGITGGFGGDRRVEYVILATARRKGVHDIVIESSCSGMFGMAGRGMSPWTPTATSNSPWRTSPCRTRTRDASYGISPRCASWWMCFRGEAVAEQGPHVRQRDHEYVRPQRSIIHLPCTRPRKASLRRQVGGAERCSLR